MQTLLEKSGEAEGSRMHNKVLQWTIREFREVRGQSAGKMEGRGFVTSPEQNCGRRGKGRRKSYLKECFERK